jgi:1,4-dihydroxy-2-naphthoate octaprenyltransferase
LFSLIIASILGLILAFRSGPGILLFGLFGAFSSYFYTAPPLRLAARKGLGELLIGLNFGPLVTAGTVYALTGSVTLSDFFIGIPIGLLTTAILWINQFPDEISDRETGKINLVVLLGKKRARWGYLLLLALAFGIILYWLVAGALPLSVLLILASIPLAVYAGRIAVREYDQRSLIRANAATIQLHLAFGLLLVVGLLVSVVFGGSSVT